MQTNIPKLLKIAPDLTDYVKKSVDAGVSAPTAYRILRGAGNVRLDNFIKVCRAVGIDPRQALPEAEVTK